jgi:hypothetical protein
LTFIISAIVCSKYIIEMTTTLLDFKATCDIDFTSNNHYEYLRSYLGMFMDNYMHILISYLFNNNDIIRQIEPVNRKKIIRDLKKLSKSDIINLIKTELLDKINANIICVCASHIDNTERLDKLENMIESWNHQVYSSKLILSLSFDDKFLIETENKIIHLKNVFGDKLIIIKQTECKSQFQHYEIICNTYHEQFKDYWIIFSDDDDVWSPDRTFIFALMIQNAINGNFEDKISYAEYPFLCEGNIYISSWNGVNHSMINNKVERKCETGTLEYTCYSLKFNNFKIFIDKSGPIILAHRLCDRYFIKFLKLCPTINKTSMLLPFFGFSYYYFNSKYIKQDTSDNMHTLYAINNNKMPIISINNMIINFDNDTFVNNLADYIVTVYYSLRSDDSKINEHLHYFLKQIESKHQKNIIFIKCIDTFKNNNHGVFKNSPILTDGVLNRMNV